jgi:hypothetical protein
MLASFLSPSLLPLHRPLLLRHQLSPASLSQHRPAQNSLGSYSMSSPTHTRTNSNEVKWYHLLTWIWTGISSTICSLQLLHLRGLPKACMFPWYLQLKRARAYETEMGSWDWNTRTNNPTRRSRWNCYQRLLLRCTYHKARRCTVSASPP